MRYADLSPITEAQLKTQQFEGEIERIQLLAQAPKAEGWRYRAAQWLLRSAARLEPQMKPRPARDAC